MLVNDEIRANIPFPEFKQKPTKLALKLQERIKYMFGITVEPIIIRRPQSYYKTASFSPLFSMKTLNNKYQISSYEQAKEMARKSAWHVLDFLLFKEPRSKTITKIIY